MNRITILVALTATLVLAGCETAPIGVGPTSTPVPSAPVSAAPSEPSSPSPDAPDVDERAVLSFDFQQAELGQQSKADLERIVQGERSIYHGGVGTEDTFVCDGKRGDVCPDYDGAQGRVLAVRHDARSHYNGTWNATVRSPTSTGPC